jgi:hypothetical protein
VALFRLSSAIGDVQPNPIGNAHPASGVFPAFIGFLAYLFIVPKPIHVRYTLNSENTTLALRFQARSFVPRGLLLIALRLATFASIAACVGTPAGGFDKPVTGQNQDTITCRIRMKNTSTCDADFETAAYRERGIHLIEWDEREQGCLERTARVRFFPGLFARADVVPFLKGLAVAVEEVPGTPR